MLRDPASINDASHVFGFSCVYMYVYTHACPALSLAYSSERAAAAAGASDAGHVVCRRKRALFL